MSGRTALIAGGGPVGAVAAIMLARQGWKIQVFEQASAPSLRPSQQDNKAYRLNLTSRALNVLKLAQVNIDPIITKLGKLLEANIYKEDGTTMRSARIPITQDPQYIRAFRDEIALCVINEAKRLHPNAIEFHFNTLIQKVNLDRQTVHVSTGSHVTEVPYDLLVGADGAASAVRSALQQIMPDGYVRRYRHKQVYSMTQVTPSNAEDIPPHAVLQMHTIKDGTVLWDALSSKDCRVGLTLPQEQADAIRQGDTARHVKLLNESAPSLPGYARKAVIDLVQSKPQFYPMPSWTHLSQLHGPKTVLLGDAAHTMSPVLGQGLNSGMEDVAVFAQCLEQQQGNVDAALPAYNKARLPDIQAIMTINEVVASFDVGLAFQDQDAVHKAWLLGNKLLLGLHMASRTALHKAAPSMFAGPRMTDVTMGNSAYRGLTSAMYKDGIMLAGGVTAAAALVVRMMY